MMKEDEKKKKGGGRGGKPGQIQQNITGKQHAEQCVEAEA